jgi:glycosyltransferase involved in cell wall biosynthesis
LPDNVKPDSREPVILVLTTRKPGYDNGNAIRIANVLEGLLGMGSVHLCLIDSTDEGQELDPDPRLSTTVIRTRERSRLHKVLDLFGRRPSAVPYPQMGALQAQLAARLGRTKWDLVWCVRARVHVLSREVISGPRIVDLDDLHDRLLLTEIRDRRDQFGWIGTAPRNLFDWFDAHRWRWLQHSIASEVDKVLICSALDQGRLGDANAAVVPNGYPNPAHDPGPHAVTDAPAPSLLFVGPLTYEPNLLAVHWMVDKVLPRIREGLPGVAFTVVGDNRGVRNTNGNGVLYTGHVVDVEPYYERATVAVVPLHSGGGTRLKVIEAMARGVPLVSTTFGVEGIDVAPGHDVLIADDPKTFANTCRALITDPELRGQLVRAGRERYHARLTAQATIAAVRALAGEVLARHGHEQE